MLKVYDPITFGFIHRNRVLVSDYGVSLLSFTELSKLEGFILVILICSAKLLWFVYKWYVLFIFWSQKGPQPKVKASATQVWVPTHSLKPSDTQYTIHLFNLL